MGIVMTVAMLLGLVFTIKVSRNYLKLLSFFNFSELVASVFLIAAGLWNIFWYSLSYWPAFWAVAALLSGLVMLITGLTLLGRRFSEGWLHTIHQYLDRYSIVTISVLAGCFTLYLVTIIQLNLGYPIIT